MRTKVKESLSAVILTVLAANSGHAEAIPSEYLVKFKTLPKDLLETNATFMADLEGATLQLVVPSQNIVLVNPQPAAIPNGDVLDKLRARNDVLLVQPNFRYHTTLYIDPDALTEHRQTPPLDWLFATSPPSDNGETIERENDPKPEVRPAKRISHAPDAKLSEDKDLELGNVREAWKTETGSRSVVVAVIDTGVDYNHEDLAANMWHDLDDPSLVGWDFVDNDAYPYDLTEAINPITGAGNAGHGTHCAGNIGAVGENGLGTSGVAQRVSIMALRMLSQEGTGATAAGIKAIDWAVEHGAQIISASWGSEGATEEDTLLKEAIQRAEARGVLFVTAAGNTSPSNQESADNDSNPERRIFPGSFDLPNIISVAASTRKGQLARFSHFGARSVHLAAPGQQSFSTVPTRRSNADFSGPGLYEDQIGLRGGRKISWDGTSMAVPQVAGAAALLLAHRPDWGYARIKRRLLESVRKERTLRGRVQSEGVLDVGRALRNTD